MLKYHYCLPILAWVYCKILTWLIHKLSGLRLDSFAISIKVWRNVLPYKGLTHAYLVKTCLTFLLLEDNDPISAKSTAQTLPLNLT